MAWLPDGENILKISLFVLAQLTNVTDRRTPGDGIYRAVKTSEADRLKEDKTSIYTPTHQGILLTQCHEI